MKLLPLTALIAAICCLSASLAHGAATRVALASAGGGDAGKDVLMLADVQLGRDPTVTLLDRREVERVLQEQKLTLSGFADSAPALAVGKILRVEVFVVLEMPSQDREPIGLVAFDAQTGVRLQDIALPKRGVEETAQKVADAVKAACAKRNRRPDALQSVCLLSVRNADLPRAMDIRCQAVGRLLERSLTRSEGIAVLERKRLEHVNKENALPTASAGGNLPASLLIIDLQVGRGAEGRGLRGTAFISKAGGKRLAEVHAAVPGEDIQALADAMQTELLKALHAAAAPTAGDRVAEASRFCREARILRGQINPFAALAAAESAYALNPSDRENLRQLELALHVSAVRLIHGATAAEGFALASRSIDIRKEGFRLASEPGKPAVEYMLGISVDDPGLQTACHASAMPIEHWPAEARPAVQDFREKYHRHVVQRLTHLAADSEQDEGVFVNFLWQWDSSLLADAASNGHEYVADLTTIFGRLFDSWKKTANGPLSHVSGSNINQPLCFFVLDAHPPRHYQLTPQDYEGLRPILESMRRHPVRLVQDYGAWGEIWLAQKLQRSGPSLDELKALVHKNIEQPGMTPANQARENHYLAMLDALRYLKLDNAQRRREHIELLNFMLDRHEMVRRVVEAALSAPAANRQEAEQLIALIDRTVAVLDGGVPEIPGAPGYVVAAIRKELGDWRARIEASWPEFARATPLSVPWKQVRPLLRKGDLHVRGFAGPVICDNKLLAARLPRFSSERAEEDMRGVLCAVGWRGRSHVCHSGRAVLLLLRTGLRRRRLLLRRRPGRRDRCSARRRPAAEHRRGQEGSLPIACGRWPGLKASSTWRWPTAGTWSAGIPTAEPAKS